jgi:outer membrane protein TolC
MVLATFLVAASANAITLDALLQQTIDHNPEIGRAKLEVERATGQRLVFHSVALPNAIIGVVAGDQGGHRAGQKRNQPFAFGYGAIAQPLFNASIPATWRRGDVEVLIAQQKLNIAVTQQLHGARIAFYSALYNRQLSASRDEERQRLAGNTATQKSRYEAGLAQRGELVASDVQEHALDARVETARRAYDAALLEMQRAAGDLSVVIQPEGALDYGTTQVDLTRSAEIAVAHRPDIELARLMVRAAEEDQRMIEASYYPQLNGVIAGEYIPVSSVRRTESQGSPRRSDDYVSSEIRFGGAYTWRVIDNGKVGGAVAKKRAIKQLNELVLQRMERDVPRDLARINNDLQAIAANEKALRAASGAAEENAQRLQQNVDAGVGSQLEFRLGQNDLLDVRTALLSLAYKQQVDLAEWDRATGRYLHFLDGARSNVQ